MLFPVLCGHSIIFLLAANLDLFINPSLHTFRLQQDKCMGTTLFYQHLGPQIKVTRIVSAQFINYLVKKILLISRTKLNLVNVGL